VHVSNLSFAGSSWLNLATDRCAPQGVVQFLKRAGQPPGYRFDAQPPAFVARWLAARVMAL
jgi:hypothetical protein